MGRNIYRIPDSVLGSEDIELTETQTIPPKTTQLFSATFSKLYSVAFSDCRRLMIFGWKSMGNY